MNGCDRAKCVLREDWRLGLGKFEHAGVEVADGSLDWEGDWDEIV